MVHRLIYFITFEDLALVFDQKILFIGLWEEKSLEMKGNYYLPVDINQIGLKFHFFSDPLDFSLNGTEI